MPVKYITQLASQS